MKSEKKDVDYIFEHIVGGFGWWQVLNTLFLWPATWVGGIPLFITVFSAYSPPHRCLVPGCDTPESLVNASWNEFAIPKG